MKLAVYGAGAIGGFIGARLAASGVEVSLVARGAQRAAIVEHGLTLRSAEGELKVRVPCVDDPAELGAQDYVLIALKAHSVAAVVERLPALFHADTAVIWAVNGLPWWYFHGLEGPYRDTRIASVDADGSLSRIIGARRIIGCVVYPACEVVAPGVIQHLEGDRFTLGEPSGEKTARVSALSDALRNAGFKAPVRREIRDELWVKLWGNLSFNPISALTGATLDVICNDPGTRAVARAMMVEAQTIAEALGVKFAIDVDKRIAGAAAVGAHKTSMLQDLERGRKLETDALVAAVAELGRLVGVATPTIATVLALVEARAREAGCG
ncbi:MAG: 2-dehydropantoate 2-reductase [Gammaproteobacteria bacterium]|nr:2-dehydropantoate 2-reductase [Gammaproteobacteria bacterium]